MIMTNAKSNKKCRNKIQSSVLLQKRREEGKLGAKIDQSIRHQIKLNSQSY